MKATNFKNYLLVKYQKAILLKKEAAIELRSSESTIDRLRKEDKLKATIIGGRVFFTIDELTNYIFEKQEV